MSTPPFRLNYGRVTIRYGDASVLPQIQYDGVTLISAINSQVVIDELVPDVCGALALLSQSDPDACYLAADKFFEAFTYAWQSLLSQGNTKDAATHWVRILTLVKNWENSNSFRVHKGSPYYFLGATYLISKDYDLGLRYLFDAIEEDKRAGAPDAYKTAPAYMVASLVDDPHNLLFAGLVNPARRLLEDYLRGYRSRAGSSMTLADFETKFLKNKALEFQKFFFVYSLFELIKHRVAWKPNVQNDFAAMRNRDIIFDLCLVIDETLRERFPPAHYISDGVFNICRSKSWVPGLNDAGQLNANLNPRVSGDSAPLPDVTVPSLLGRTMTYQGTPVTEQMSWLLLSWHLRNYAAHDLAPQSVLLNRYDEIVDALMNALFLTVD